MDLGVQGQGFLLLGGTAGMGLATAEVLARDGAALVLVGRDEDRAHRVADELATAHGTAVHGVAGDIALPGVADRVVEQAADLLDDLAGVGVFTGTKGHSPLSASDEEWTAAFEDVLLGPTRALRAVVPRLVARGGGTIVTVAAYGIHAPQAERIAYGSLKSAVTVLTKGIAEDVRPRRRARQLRVPRRHRDRRDARAARHDRRADATGPTTKPSSG